MLFYRARLEGALATVVSITAGPVRRQIGLGREEGLARVTLRYALTGDGAVRVHRGWLHTGLPGGTRLRVTGYQVDGLELLLSLSPVRPTRGEPERLDDQFTLPFCLQSWGVTAVRAVAARLRLGCAVRPQAMLLHGRLVLEIEAPASRFRLVLPFCRLLSVTASEELAWRAYGGVVGLSLRVEPGGAVVGEAHLAVRCVGRQPAGPLDGAEPGMVVVQELVGRVAGQRAEVLHDGLALVEGKVVLDIYGADRSGRSRWREREVPFSTLLAIPDLLEGDRLDPVAGLDRLTRVGDRAVLALSVGLTALRTVHLCVDSQWYRVEQVVGQAVATLTATQVLLDPPSLPPPEPAGRSGALATLPEPPADGWRALHLRLRSPAAAGGGWRSLLSLRATPTSGEAEQRATLSLGGSLPQGGGDLVAGLAAVGPEAVMAGVVVIPSRGVRLGREGEESHRSVLAVDLPGPVQGVLGLALTGGSPWLVRLLLRFSGGPRLITVPLPAEAAGPGQQPNSATAYGLTPACVHIDVRWRRADA